MIFKMETFFTFQAITLIGKEEGLKGYWKGNLPQVLHISYMFPNQIHISFLF